MTILLDIDGVMTPIKSWKKQVLLNDGLPEFSLKAIRALNSIISNDTTILLTTSHRHRFSLEEWIDIFKKRGVLEIKNLIFLDPNVNYLSRKDEILNWFNSSNIDEDFIIIDDDKSLNDLPKFIKEKLILTSPIIGLTEDNLTL